jgi:L-ascorbate metabolism protein UlaG (beta-lactamase superfamily)
MRLTKLEHACVRLEKDGVTLAIDPSVWSMPEALVGVSAVLVTHEHFDHLDADGLRAALDADPGLQLWTNQAVASQFAGFSRDQVHVVDHGDAFSGDSFTVPEDPVQTLLLPASGPWLKTGEMIDYAREVSPQRGYVIHEALFGDTGLTVLESFLPLCGKNEDDFSRIDVGATIEV